MKKETNLVELITKKPSKIKEVEQTEELAKIALTSRGSLVAHIKEQFLTDEIVDDLIKNSPKLIAKLPVNKITRERAILAIKEDDTVYVALTKRGDVEFLYEDSFLEEVVKYRGTRMSVIPFGKQTEEMAYNSVTYGGGSLRYIFDKLKTDRVVKSAIEKDGNELKYVHNPSQAFKYYELAVRTNGEALKYIKNHQITEKLCRIAIKQNGQAIEYVPRKFLVQNNYELPRLALKTYWKALALIPKMQHTEELCAQAYALSSESVIHMTTDLITEEMALKMVEDNPSLFEKLPFTKQSRKVILKALELDITNIRFVVAPTEEMVAMAVKADGSMINHVPPLLFTEELILDAIKTYPKGIAVTRSWMATKGFIEKVIHTNVECFRFLLPSQKTPEICMLAYSLNPALVESF